MRPGVIPAAPKLSRTISAKGFLAASTLRAGPNVRICATSDRTVCFSFKAIACRYADTRWRYTAGRQTPYQQMAATIRTAPSPTMMRSRCDRLFHQLITACLPALRR